MVDTGSMPLGSVAVEVKADLSKLVADFARARVQTQAFSNDLSRAVAPTTQFTVAQKALSTQISGLVRQYQPVEAAQARYASDLGVVRQAEQAGMIASGEADVLRQKMAANFAILSEKTSDSGKGLAGWARETEHHLRAMRLLLSFVGVQIAARLGEFAIKTIEATAAIKDQAEQLGLTTSQLQEYRGIASQVGMSSGDMDKAFQHLSQTLKDMALGKADLASKLFKRLGIDIHDVGGKVRPTSDIFRELIDRLGQVGDATQRSGALGIAFGEAGAKMGELVKKGSGGIDQLREALRATGAVLSEEQIQKADQTAKKLEMMSTVLKAKLASTVVDNADSIYKLADALSRLAAVSLANIVHSIGDLAARIEQLVKAAQALSNIVPSLPNPGKVSADIGTYYYGQKPATGLIGQMLDAVGMNSRSPPPVSTTVKLDPAKPYVPKGPNISLAGLESPKAKKAKEPKFDTFEEEMAAELAQQLQLEHDATTDIIEQNRIEKEIIDQKTKQKDQQIDKQVKSKSLTAAEGKQLKAQEAINASAEKEAADRKMRLADIERANQFADEVNRLEEDRLNVAKSLARTDAERKAIDAKILDIKQRQAITELQKAIAIAEENKDEQRVAELTSEIATLRATQLTEWKQFGVEHLTGIEKFRNDLPKTVQEINEQLDRIRFDQFTERLQRAADMAKSIGDAFGQFVGDLASFKNPLEALKSLIGSLAKTMTENVIVKPVSDWATQHIGVPLAKQAFGKAMTSGPDALTPKQFDMALAQATGTLGGFEKVLPGASSGIGSITTAATPASTSLNTLASAAESAASALTSMAANAGAGGGGGGGLGGLGSLLGGMGGAGGAGGDGGLGGGTFDILGGAGDMFSPSSLLDAGTLADMSSLGIGFATGGFTGAGADHEPKGVVHANEFVLNSDAVSQYGLPLLGSMNSGSASVLRAGGGPGPARAATAATAGGADLTNAAQMLMQAAQMLMDATKNMGGGGGKGGAGGMLGSLLGIATGALLGGGKGGGIGKMLGGMFGGGGGGVVDLTGPAFASQLGHFDGGGFTGTGSDHEPAGVVHKNEYVWDAPTTRQWMPVLQLIGSGRLPSFQGPGLGQTKPRGGDSRPQVIHIDEVHLHGVTDERTARQTANQFMGHVQHRTAQVNRRGLNK